MKSNNIANCESKGCAIGAMSDAEFRATIMDILNEGMSEDECFVWLYALTMSVYDIEAKENPCSKGRVKRWSDLANIWGRCAEVRGEPNLFALAIYKIHWGVYPNNIPESIPIDMVEAVEDALLQDGESYSGWKRNQYYRDAFESVVDWSYQPGNGWNRPLWHSHYIRNRTWLRIVYKQVAPRAIDLSHFEWREFTATKKHANIYHECKGYEMIVSRLLPEALTWQDAQWSDEHLLRRKLKSKLNVDATVYSKEFDHIIDFLKELWYYKETSVVRLLSIKNMPDALMEAIWPVHTQHEVTNLLCLAYSRVKSAHTFLGKYDMRVHGCAWSKLRESWIYNRCKEWVYNGELTDAAPRTSKIVFEIESGIAA